MMIKLSSIEASQIQKLTQEEKNKKVKQTDKGMLLPFEIGIFSATTAAGGCHLKH